MVDGGHLADGDEVVVALNHALERSARILRNEGCGGEEGTVCMGMVRYGE